MILQLRLQRRAGRRGDVKTLRSEQHSRISGNVLFPTQYFEHSQPEHLATAHQALLNGPRLSRSNENDSIRSSGAQELATTFTGCRVTVSLQRAKGQRARNSFRKESN